MLTNATRMRATIPAQDLARARAFYSEKLGLEVAEEDPTGVIFQAGPDQFTLFQSRGAASGSHTQMGWDVADVEAEVAELKSRGVTFEEYDMPGFKTENSIATIPGGKGGWFKDSEGNLLSVFRRQEAAVTS
jgi:catechol 2,3-dioxygenase-like lactoylglutathione lyase family enzyme